MADGKRERPDEIGVPDPDHEPVPPRIHEAGDLGEVGERKMEEGMDKQGIWPHREPPRDVAPDLSRIPGEN